MTTLSEFAAVAVPRVAPALDVRLVWCRECKTRSDAVEIANEGFLCPDCGVPICVMCGCTDRVACIGGCRWVFPGRCSSHNEELRLLALQVFLGPLTARELADGLDYGYDDVVELLEGLRDEGLARNPSGEPTEDSEWIDYLGGRLRRAEARWLYCGGPISQALSVESQISDSKIQDGR